MRWSAVAATLAVAGWTLAAARPAGAKSFRAEPYTSEVAVQANGDLQVTEVLRLRFDGGPFTRADRRMPRRHLDDIVIETASDSFAVERRRNRVRVVWHFAPCRDTTITLSLRYRVRGALRSDGNLARLEWYAFPDARRYAIHGAHVTVTWPETWRALDARSRRARVALGARQADFTAARLGEEDGIRVRMQFETPVVLAAPAWQRRLATQRARFGVFAAGCAALATVGIMLVIVQRREMVPGRTARITHAVTAPPTDLPPALVGALRGGGAGMAEAQACIGDLARRGYLDIETERARARWAGGIYILHRRRDGHDLALWERIVHEAAFRKSDRDRIRIDRAWNQIGKRLGEFKAAVRSELQRRGALDPQAVAARTRLRTTMWVWWALALAALAAAPIAWDAFGPTALLAVVAASLPAILAAFLAQRMPLHSPSWSGRVAEWDAFRRHLMHTAKQRTPLDARRYEAWVPYALALRVAPAWICAAKRWQLAPPHWFEPAWTAGSKGAH
jgi:hypothetical protein